MPSASQPDEVVQVFAGDSLEEAMAAAVAALGPDLGVRRARKVRAGVRGLMGKDRYEVLAVPGEAGVPDAPARDGDAVAGAFAALMERAEAQDSPDLRQPAAAARAQAARSVAERAATPRSPIPSPPAAPSRPARTVAGDGEAAVAPARLRSVPEPYPAGAAETLRARQDARLRAADEREARGEDGEDDDGPDGAAGAEPHPLSTTRNPGPRAGQPDPHRIQQPVEEPVQTEPRQPRRQPHPEPEVADHAPRRTADPAPARRGAAKAAPSKGTRRPARTRRVPGWSLKALVELGVPDSVLELVEPPGPGEDLAWVAALAAALEQVLPRAAEPDEDNPVVVSGYGVHGALALVEAAVAGQAVGTITTDGRTVAATATELALVLRGGVLGGGV